MFSDQSQFDVRFEWGERGLKAVASTGCLIVIVDVLSFSTCVDVACSRGAVVLPHAYGEENAAQYAREQGAMLAGRRAAGGYSLSPASLVAIPAGTRLVLPSPNGAVLSISAAQIGTAIAGCLRNAAAVAQFAGSQRRPIAVIACGERWPDGSLRPALEDLLGAGAMIAGLTGTRSPEAQAAQDLFHAASGTLRERILASSSGRELVERGFEADVALASEHDVSRTIPVLTQGCFRCSANSSAALVSCQKTL